MFSRRSSFELKGMHVTWLEELKKRSLLVKRQLELPSWGLILSIMAGVVITWKLPVVAPDQPGGDHDYWYLINEAAKQSLDFGHEVSTTYGPLYFLTVPMVDSPRQIIAAFGIWGITSGIVGTALFQTLDRVSHRAVAIGVLSLVLMSSGLTPLSSTITMSFVYLVLLGLLYGMGLLPQWGMMLFPSFSAVVTALMALNKFSVAGMCGAAALVAILARPNRLWAFAQFAVLGVLTASVAWLMVGQNLLSLPTYVLRALSVGSGQSGAMGLELPERGWEYVVVVPAVVVIGWVLFRLRPRNAWVIPYWLGYGVALILLFKQAFVRHDGHSAQFFALAVCLAALGIGVAWESVKRSGLVGVTVILAVAQLGAYGTGLDGLDFSKRLAAFGSGVVNVVSPESRADAMLQAKANLRAKLQIPQTVIDRIGDKRVYVEPFNYAAGFAYGFNDAILPTLLEYGAYNQELDALNRSWIESSVSPDIILRKTADFTLDGRNPAWDAPQQKLAERCWYSEAYSAEGWSILTRLPASACGEAHEQQEVNVASGEEVPVPHVAGMLTVVRVTPDVTWGDRLRGALFKRDNLMVSTSSNTYRLPWGHSGSPLVLEGETSISMNVGGTVQFELIEIDPAE